MLTRNEPEEPCLLMPEASLFLNMQREFGRAKLSTLSWTLLYAVHLNIYRGLGRDQRLEFMPAEKGLS